MPRKIVFDPEPIEGGNPRMSLLYTLRPGVDDPDLADQNDATAYSTQLSLPTTRRLSFSALVGDTSTDPDALIQYVVINARGKISDPPNAATRYSLPELVLEFETGEVYSEPTTMWGVNSFATRTSGHITQSPRGNDWTLAELLESFIGAAVTVQGGTNPGPKFSLADVWLDVYGIPSSEIAQRKFESGVYRLNVDGLSLVAPLTAAETRAVHIAAVRSGKALTLSALVLDNGDFQSGDSYEVNSSYQDMLDAIANGGSVTPPEV